MDYFVTDDTEYQILSRVNSLKMLDRCKAVCKRWYNIINEASFMPCYCLNTRNMYGYILQFWEHKSTRKYSKALVSINRHGYSDGASSSSSSPETGLKFDDDVEIVASSMQGVVCCVKRAYKVLGIHLYVWKPTTAQWQEIPGPRLLIDMVGLIILSNKPLLRYKIILISRHHSDVNGRCKYRLQIFNSRTWKWSKSIDLQLPDYESPLNQQGIHVGRFLYFLMEKLVIAFNGHNEETFQIPIPESISSFLYLKKAIEYQGKLGLICLRDRSMQLWILDYHQETTCERKWNKIKEVDLSFIGLHSGVFHPVGFYNADILVLKHNGDNDNIRDSKHRYESMIFCNIQDFNYKEVKLDNHQGYRYQCFPFRSDMEAVDLSPPDLTGSC